MNNMLSVSHVHDVIRKPVEPQAVFGLLQMILSVSYSQDVRPSAICHFLLERGSVGSSEVRP